MYLTFTRTYQRHYHLFHFIQVNGTSLQYTYYLFENSMFLTQYTNCFLQPRKTTKNKLLNRNAMTTDVRGLQYIDCKGIGLWFRQALTFTILRWRSVSRSNGIASLSVSGCVTFWRAAVEWAVS